MEQTIGYALHHLLNDGVCIDEALCFFECIKKPYDSFLTQEILKEYLEYLEEVEDNTNLEAFDPYVENPFQDSRKVKSNSLSKYYCKISNESIFCTICQEKNTDNVMLSCNHYFCKECISQWLSKSILKCPNCGCEPTKKS